MSYFASFDWGSMPAATLMAALSGSLTSLILHVLGNRARDAAQRSLGSARVRAKEIEAATDFRTQLFARITRLEEELARADEARRVEREKESQARQVLHEKIQAMERVLMDSEGRIRELAHQLDQHLNGHPSAATLYQRCMETLDVIRRGRGMGST